MTNYCNSCNKWFHTQDITFLSQDETSDLIENLLLIMEEFVNSDIYFISNPDFEFDFFEFVEEYVNEIISISHNNIEIFI